MTLPIFGQPIARIDEALLDALVSGGSGFWQEVANVDIVAGASEVSVTGLDGDTDEVYGFVLSFLENGTGSGFGYIRMNNDSGSNYNHQRLVGDGATASAIRQNAQADGRYGFIGANESVVVSGYIFATTTGGDRVIQTSGIQGVSSGGTSPAVVVTTNQWRNAVDNVVSLQFGLLAGQFAAGSRLVILKPQAGS